MTKIPLSTLLTLNGGYVDTVGFLALQGLFTAHVTGNFVTLGATVATGSAGALPKLLALPVFCVFVLLVRLISFGFQNRGWPVLRFLLVSKFALLAAAALFSIHHGLFTDANSISSLIMGMTLVAAMAIQNALHRVHLPKSPPSTLMTGTTTQVMLDIGEIIASRQNDGSGAVYARLKRMSLAVVAFALGCGAGAFVYVLSPIWCFVPPVCIAALAFVAKTETAEGG